MARVIVSAGHTSTSPGTVVGDLREVDYARKIAKHLTGALRQFGIITLSVPYDLELDKRINWINSTGYRAESNDIFIELHINDGGKTGLEAWFAERGSSKNLAEEITNKLQKKFDFKIQGVRPESQHPIGGINILKQVRPLAVLIECFYIDNKEDQKILRDDNKLQQVAKETANAIADFLGLSNLTAKSATKTQPPVNKQQNPSVMPDLKTTPNYNPPVQNLSQPNPVNSTPDMGEDLDDDFDDFDFTPSQSSSPAGNFSPPPAAGFGGGGVNSFNQPAGGMPGGFGANPVGGGFGNNSLGGGMGAFGANNKPAMTRDERKDMVVKYYKKAFGKEPAQNDLNYFLNIGITEEQFLKRIIDSQDMRDQSENATKYKEIKEKYDDLKSKYDSLQKKLEDQRQILEKLNSLLLQKNYALTELQKRARNLMERLEEIQNRQVKSKATVDYKPTKKESIFSFFSKKLS